MSYPTVHVVTVRTGNGNDQKMSVAQLVAEGHRAYVNNQPPAVHLTACGDDVVAASSLHLVITDGLGSFSHMSGLVLAALNKSSYARGTTPIHYPIRAEASYSAANQAVGEYRRSVKEARAAAAVPSDGKTNEPSFRVTE